MHALWYRGTRVTFGHASCQPETSGLVLICQGLAVGTEGSLSVDKHSRDKHLLQ